ncbi:hypothetical protein [Microvirga sp. M2]|uniref:hypothetical protein n=1 Tax=Microvirga sp. M2 TaxID=3073270 RepID=UPI0039C046DA
MFQPVGEKSEILLVDHGNAEISARNHDPSGGGIMPDGAQERVIGVLPSAEALQAAVDRLELAGFDRAQFGVLAPQAAVEGWRRHPTATATDVALDPAAPTGAYMEPESEGAAAGGLIGSLFYLGAGLAAGGIILTGGSLGVALAGVAAAGGTGGLLGALLAYGFHHEHARTIHDQLEHGGLVLWIQPRTAEQHDLARAELEAAGAREILTRAES